MEKLEMLKSYHLDVFTLKSDDRFIISISFYDMNKKYDPETGPPLNERFPGIDFKEAFEELKLWVKENARSKIDQLFIVRNIKSKLINICKKEHELKYLHP